MAVNVEKLHRHFSTLVERRMAIEPLWRETAKYYLPTSMTWQSGLGTSFTSTVPQRGIQVFDDTPAWAAGRFAAAMLGMIMNPGQKWLEFELYTDHDNLSDAGKAWLQELRDRVLFTLQLPDVGFYDAMHEHLLDYGIFGESVMLIDKNPKTGLPRFTPYPLEQCYVGMSERRTPDTVFRRHEMSVQALVDVFGMDALPKSVREKYAADKYLEKLTVIHAVFPRTHGIAGGFADNKPWASVHYLEQDKHLLRESGFDVFPFSCPRFTLFASQDHGQGPGTLSLANVKTLNSIIKTMLRSDQRKAAPAYVASRRGWIKQLNFTPDAVNYFDGYDMDKSLIPIGNEGQPQAGREWVQMYQEQILRAFYLDRLITQDKRAEVKEMEVLTKEEERMRDLVPQLSRLHAESISHIVLNTIMYVGDMMGPPPPDIGKNSVKIRYLSPLARAQRLLEVSNANRTLQQVIIPLAQIDPTATKAIDIFKFANWSLDQSGFPQEVRVSEEQFLAEKQAEEQQQQAAMVLQAGESASVTAKNFSQAQQATPDPLKAIFG